MTRCWRSLVLMSFLLGCAAPLEQRQGPAITAPQLEVDAFLAADGARLAVQIWDAEEPQAIFVALHGMNDYSKTFQMPGPWFAERGITTYAYDQRGFGRSPEPGIWPSEETLLNDSQVFIEQVRKRHPDLPLYVIGVSMGGAVAIAMLARDEGLQIDGLVLVAPAVWGWSVLNPFYKIALWIAAHTFPGAHFTGEGLEIWPSDNIEMLRDNYYDELMIKETRTDAIYGLVGIMDKGYLSVEKVSVPTLVLYGEKDEIIPRKPVEGILGRLGGPTRVVVYENGYHMLLRDLQAETVWKDIEAWIRDSSGNLPSGEERQILASEGAS